MLDLFLLLWPLLSIAFILSISIGIHNGLPQGTLPLCLNVKVPLFSSQRNTLTLLTSKLLQKRRNNTSSPWGWLKPGDILQDLWPFYFTSSPPPHLCSIKEANIQTLIGWYSRTLVHHLLGCPTFWIKSLFLASTPRLPIYWPVVQQAEQAGTR